MEDLITIIKKREWPEEDKRKALSLLKKDSTTKENNRQDLIHWIFLFIMIIANLLISIVLIPILLVLQGIFLYLIVFIIGLTFGFLFNILLIEIQSHEKDKKIVAGLLIPALAAINVYYIVSFSNFLIPHFNLKTTPHSSIIVGVLYAIGFLIPYYIYKLVFLRK
jgi:hypothetical protein